MAINLSKEQPLSCSQAGRVCEKLGGKKKSPSQVYRWVTRGVDTPKGRIHLDSARTGRQIVTTELALLKFFNSLGDAYRQAATDDLSEFQRQAGAELDEA